MRPLIYAGLGFMVGWFTTSLVYLLFFWGTPQGGVGFVIQVIGIVGGSIWGSRGFPIGGFRLPGIKSND